MEEKTGFCLITKRIKKYHKITDQGAVMDGYGVVIGNTNPSSPVNFFSEETVETACENYWIDKINGK